MPVLHTEVMSLDQLQFLLGPKKVIGKRWWLKTSKISIFYAAYRWCRVEIPLTSLKPCILLHPTLKWSHQNFPAFSACLSRRSWSGSFLRNVGGKLGYQTVDLNNFDPQPQHKAEEQEIHLCQRTCLHQAFLRVKGNHFTCKIHFHTMHRNYIIL